jgi:hypothetical protein
MISRESSSESPLLSIVYGVTCRRVKKVKSDVKQQSPSFTNDNCVVLKTSTNSLLKWSVELPGATLLLSTRLPGSGIDLADDPL